MRRAAAQGDKAWKEIWPKLTRMPSALVTGATAGIGAAFARRLARDGCDLVLVARDRERLDKAAAELSGESGRDVTVLSADLATDAGIAAVEERLRTHPVDLLVNNAGFGHRAKFLGVPVGDELAMLKVHVEAVLRLTTAALPSMVERRRGGIVNVASVAAFFPRGTYGASKAWVVSFSRSVRHEVAADGVRVLALCPGFTHTEFHNRAGIDASGVPEQMWLDADSVVDTALRDLRAGRAVSVPGWRYKAIVRLGAVVPPDLTGRISSRLGRR